MNFTRSSSIICCNSLHHTFLFYNCLHCNSQRYSFLHYNYPLYSSNNTAPSLIHRLPHLNQKLHTSNRKVRWNDCSETKNVVNHNRNVVKQLPPSVLLSAEMISVNPKLQRKNALKKTEPMIYNDRTPPNTYHFKWCYKCGGVLHTLATTRGSERDTTGYPANYAFTIGMLVEGHQTFSPPSTSGTSAWVLEDSSFLGLTRTDHLPVPRWSPSHKSPGKLQQRSSE